MRRLACAFLAITLWLPGGAFGDGLFLLPKTALAPYELGLIVNDNDPASREIASYYQARRGIPKENVIHVQLPALQDAVDPASFRAVYDQVRSTTPRQVQAYALAWTRPFRVGCMSITSAFATGYDRHYCAEIPIGKPCGVSGASPYYNSASRQPWSEFGIRPAMLLASHDLAEAKHLIDRGIAADSSYPKGTAYLLSTSDRARTVRDRTFANVEAVLGSRLHIEVLEQNSLKGKDDVLFYFTGLRQVPDLETLRFLPGAIADHLTSYGGNMSAKPDSPQMSSLRWLEAGATGSYGTVKEPCAYLEKFPQPGLVMTYYLSGSTLIEAYWKSVAWPGEGLFIGEPLTAPFFRPHVSFTGNTARIPVNQFHSGLYRLQAATYPVGPYQNTGAWVQVSNAGPDLRIGGLDQTYYRLGENETEPRLTAKASYDQNILD